MKQTLNLLFQPLSYLLIFSSFFVTIFPAALVALPFPVATRTRISAPMWRLFSQLVIHVATLSKPYKRDERSQEEQSQFPQGLYISNHQSFVDIPLIITELPIPPIMKKEVLYIPILGICGYAAGAMIVDRKDGNSRRKVFEQAKERLTNGIKALMFYPEGTRQRSSSQPKAYEEIKRPILKFAYDQNIPVYSVSIFGTRKVLSPASLKLKYGQKVGMIIRAAKKPSDYDSADDFMKDCWRQVVDGYAELQEKLT